MFQSSQDKKTVTARLPETPTPPTMDLLSLMNELSKGQVKSASQFPIPRATDFSRP
jgi:hypothetical protein